MRQWQEVQALPRQTRLNGAARMKRASARFVCVKPETFFSKDPHACEPASSGSRPTQPRRGRAHRLVAVPEDGGVELGVGATAGGADRLGLFSGDDRPPAAKPAAALVTDAKSNKRFF